MSPQAKTDVLKLADKGKGFSISTTTLPVGAMGERLKAVKQNPDLYQKLIDAVDSAPQVCRKILNYHMISKHRVECTVKNCNFKTMNTNEEYLNLIHEIYFDENNSHTNWTKKALISIT